MTQKMSVPDCIAEIIKVIGDKAPVREIEFGYHPNDDGSEPRPGSEITWWAKARTNSGRLRMAEVVSKNETGPLEALAELARELGLSVRIRYEAKS